MATGDPALVPAGEYAAWVEADLEPGMRDAVVEQYGPAPGEYMTVGEGDETALAVARVQFGNVVILPQPLPGAGDDTFRLVHGTRKAPPHPYVASYLWTRNAFQADAVMHFGTHGSLEFTPWKQIALSAFDWADALVGGLPHVYVYVMSNVGEGIIAKRRSYAATVTHLTPPFMEGRAVRRAAPAARPARQLPQRGRRSGAGRACAHDPASRDRDEPARGPRPRPRRRVVGGRDVPPEQPRRDHRRGEGHAGALHPRERLHGGRGRLDGGADGHRSHRLRPRPHRHRQGRGRGRGSRGRGVLRAPLPPARARRLRAAGRGRERRGGALRPGDGRRPAARPRLARGVAAAVGRRHHPGLHLDGGGHAEPAGHRRAGKPARASWRTWWRASCRTRERWSSSSGCSRSRSSRARRNCSIRCSASAPRPSPPSSRRWPRRWRSPRTRTCSPCSRRCRTPPSASGRSRCWRIPGSSTASRTRSVGWRRSGWPSPSTRRRSRPSGGRGDTSRRTSC